MSEIKVNYNNKLLNKFVKTKNGMSHKKVMRKRKENLGELQTKMVAGKLLLNSIPYNVTNIFLILSLNKLKLIIILSLICYALLSKTNKSFHYF
jgi:hypothetical protein